MPIPAGQRTLGSPLARKPPGALETGCAQEHPGGMLPSVQFHQIRRARRRPVPVINPAVLVQAAVDLELAYAHAWIGQLVGDLPQLYVFPLQPCAVRA